MKKIILSAVLFVFISATNSFAQFSTQKLEQHNKFLASDSLKGRKPGTPEDIVAAKYIRDQFKEYGLNLLADEGFQYFNVQADIKLSDGNFLKIGKSDIKINQQYSPIAYSANGNVNAQAVFVGFGFDINEQNFKQNDFENIDIKGKWAIILRGSPDNSPHGNYEAFASVRTKVMNAAKYGAAGVILVSGNNFDPDDELLTVKFERGLMKTQIPVINVKREIADKILLKSKKTVNQLEKEIIDTKKTVSFNTKTFVNANVNVEFVSLPTQNVIALLQSNDPEFGNQYIVIGAHYDHLGFGGKGSGSRRPDTIAIHNGADDNASGVASLLVLAKEFANCKTKPKKSIIFIAFGAEEMGLLGSKYFVENPLVDLKSIKAMLNIDMVGRLADNGYNLAIIGTGTAKEFEEILDNHKSEFKHSITYNKSGYGGSDHSSFYAKDIPVLFFNSGSETEYHTPFDDTELIDFEEQAQITDLIYKIARDFADNNYIFTYQNTGNDDSKQKMSFKVTLGIMPAYADLGNSGLKVDGVTKDGAADKAGIIKNDIITELDGTKITNIYDYMEVLKRLKKGQKTGAKVNRNNQIIDIELQF